VASWQLTEELDQCKVSLERQTFDNIARQCRLISSLYKEGTLAAPDLSRVGSTKQEQSAMMSKVESWRAGLEPNKRHQIEGKTASNMVSQLATVAAQ
jgi:hypothetical protein